MGQGLELHLFTFFLLRLRVTRRSVVVGFQNVTAYLLLFLGFTLLKRQYLSSTSALCTYLSLFLLELFACLTFQNDPGSDISSLAGNFGVINKPIANFVHALPWTNFIL